MPDRVFLITGASSGIGASTARQAAAAGYRVVLAARSLDRLTELAAELGGEERAFAVRCDVTDWDQQQAMVSAVLSRFGRLDVAFANAGFGAARGFLNESPEHWRAMVLTNVYGVALTIRAVLPALKDARGHLLLTGSLAGRRALPGSLYSATKFAVSAMGEAARIADFDGHMHRQWTGIVEVEEILIGCLQIALNSSETCESPDNRRRRIGKRSSACR